MKKGSLGAKPPSLKSKSKVKAKRPEKRFDPLQYLNSLIDEVHVRPHNTVKKRSKSISAKRQLVSAMARTAPYIQSSVSQSKVRSKSSYSQYRKKSVTIRDPLRANLNLLTEEDNIQFTESTIKENDDEVTRLEPICVVTLSRAAAARKIQRAWRNYQTSKVVRKYFDIYSGLMKRSKQLKEIQSNRRSSEQYTVKRQLEHTLKIRREDVKGSPHTAKKCPKPVFRVLDFSGVMSRQDTRQIEFGSNETHTVELRTTENREQGGSKQLQLLIDLFRKNQETAVRGMEQKLNAVCDASAGFPFSRGLSKNEEGSVSFVFEENKEYSEIDGLSPLIFQEMEAVVQQKYDLFKAKLEEQGLSVEERRKSMEQLEGRFMREMRAIDRCKQQYLRSAQQLREGMLKMQNDSAVVNRLGSPLSLRVRKSYSADSLIMKSILQEICFKNMDLDLPKFDDLPIVLEGDFRRKKKMEEGVSITIPTSPPSVVPSNLYNASNDRSEASLACQQVDTERKLRQALFESSEKSIAIDLFIERNPQISEFEQEERTEDLIERCDSASSVNLSLHENSFREGENSRMIRECSQEIEQQIEAVLIEELVQIIYKQSRFWQVFKPLVENPYKFKAITDYQIGQFLQKELPQYYSSEDSMLQRINQKINPTTLQILRLIRDFQFQIDEYDLVLPEEVFKAYRKNLEAKYQVLIKAQQQRKIEADKSLSDQMKRLVLERGCQKRSKCAKFISFQRDLRIMYMKAVFNCFNQLIIETKSLRTFMNGRSSIGPGELTLAMKQFNSRCGQQDGFEVMSCARGKLMQIVGNKCVTAQFRNHRELEMFQRQISRMIWVQMCENEYKWVNYMDEVLELWQQLSLWLWQQLMEEVVVEISSFLS